MKKDGYDTIKEKFQALYGQEGAVYFAPGRVNLIGEHTDYNGGHVFPCALSIGTYAAAAKRKDRKLRFYSMNFEDSGVIETDIDSLTPSKSADWTDYPKGMIAVLREQGMRMECGMDIMYYGNIPNGSGLSSSASIEVLTGYLLAEEYGFSFGQCPLAETESDRAEGVILAKLAQYSENHFNGVNCGIMDQFAVAMGKKGHAIYLDTADLTYDYVPVNLGDACLVIACSNKKRGLADSKYNERRAECEEALRRINQVRRLTAGKADADTRQGRDVIKESAEDGPKGAVIGSLGELTEEELREYESAIGDKTLYRRARHAVTENERTSKAVALLKQGKLEEFGRLMDESHRSLRDDYEVTGMELDTLAETAWQTDGVIGSRMTGAGFGGCSVSLVKKDAVDGFIEHVGRKYRERIGYNADFYEVEIGGGPEKGV